MTDLAVIEVAPIAAIGSGGLLSIGETLVAVPLEALLGSEWWAFTSALAAAHGPFARAGYRQQSPT